MSGGIYVNTTDQHKEPFQPPLRFLQILERQTWHTYKAQVTWYLGVWAFCKRILSKEKAFHSRDQQLSEVWVQN